MAETIALWRLLQAASGIVAAVRAGQSATAAVERVEPAARAGAQALSFHALRQLGRASALRQLLAKRPPPPAADALLCTALALCWREEDAPYEVFTLVDQAVEAAKRGAETKAQANFINACLRRFLRERDALVKATDANPEAKWNHPRWWINRLKQDHPQHWQQILEANNSHAPMTLRVNARKRTPAQYLAQLEAAGIEGVLTGEHGVVLAKPRGVHTLPGFDEGVVSVQDAAAQLAAPLLLEGLDRTRTLRILDACAAPGGKTAHLLELADAEVVALDIDPKRCERIHDTLKRLGLAAKVIAGDAAKPGDWWDGEPFDAILLDAPCTASGIVRRHPDVRWLRRESDIAQLAAIQARLLEVLWPLLAPGGRLVYCTCSVFRSEGEAQVQTFLAHHTQAVLRPAPGHLLPQSGANAGGVPDNRQGDHDGFFYAALEKRAGP
ncbi:16S rRNA (cytosine(967)-C(5))-methyltransferase RsmB [Caenimonas aquaedulcis]|uniref:16S rRNA (cytosine(967)-C(5))-methyltransferase n=1 Tax=Caenimonas aquaedulcis TaxID=2793270 RepID=A0A931MI01_9BURK|nr:16S rRNA (cytosine(967)-C(5))-methyltransferase RsmB [Caenimonas aquaedulcis]MBG9389314.1 16S rRNA (cytosine(967)-C(5))-methyltransferase RsmB [Caenimonas aquaedulcis]